MSCTFFGTTMQIKTCFRGNRYLPFLDMCSLCCHRLAPGLQTCTRTSLACWEFLCHKLHDEDAKRRCVGLLLTSLAENAVNKASDETEVIALYPASICLQFSRCHPFMQAQWDSLTQHYHCLPRRVRVPHSWPFA